MSPVALLSLRRLQRLSSAAEWTEGELPPGELVIAKHRGGKMGIVGMAFDGGTTSYREVERNTEDEEGQARKRRY